MHTEIVGLQIASTEVCTLVSSAIGGGSSYRTGARRQVPYGILHAYEGADITRTICGQPLDGLHRWKLPWAGIGSTQRRCTRCERIARGEAE